MMKGIIGACYSFAISCSVPMQANDVLEPDVARISSQDVEEQLHSQLKTMLGQGEAAGVASVCVAFLCHAAAWLARSRIGRHRRRKVQRRKFLHFHVGRLYPQLCASAFRAASRRSGGSAGYRSARSYLRRCGARQHRVTAFNGVFCSRTIHSGGGPWRS